MSSLPELNGKRALRVLDVARAAGVSETTAAAALRGAPVSAATREKVQACAARLGYRRNTAASLLAAQRTSRSSLDLTIALLRSDGYRPARTNAILDTIARNAGVRVRRIDITPEDAATIGRRLHNEGVEAIWWHSLSDEVLRRFPLANFCHVSRHSSQLVHGLDVVRAEYFTATRRLLEEVAARGYRRFGVILREHEGAVYDDAARLGAILHFQHTQASAQGIEVHLLRLPFNSPHRVAASVAVPWLRQLQPDVVIGFHRAEHEFLEEAGLRCPRDAGYVSMVVNPDMEQEIAGILEPLRFEFPQVIRRVQDKARLRQFGPVESPVESVVHATWSPGATLPTRTAR